MKKIQWLLLLLSIFVISCENEPFDGIFIQKIDTSSELFNELRSFSETKTGNTVCFTFIYPFNVYLYNEEGDIFDSEIVNDNVEFSELLSQTQNDSFVGLSYPIMGYSEDQISITVSNNLELKEAIDACIEDQIINYTNGLLEQLDCVWKVESLNETYNNSLLDFYNDGTGVFYHNGDAFRTSWISFFLEEQLHINIHLEGDSVIAQDWNFDWEATIIDDNTILIENNNSVFHINTECNVENDCDYVEFRECILSDDEETLFVFDDYVDCITSFREGMIIPDIELHFYETMEDAEMQTNPLLTSGYNNLSNPQIIFVRASSLLVDISEITRIILYEEDCAEN